MNNNLTPQESGIVRSVAGGDVNAAAVARLYTAADNSWSYDGLWGGLALVSNGSSRYLRLINLSSSEVIWEHELYENVSYTSPKPFFHTFEGNASMIGLSFSDEGDANNFFSAVNSTSSSGARSASTLRPPMPSTPYSRGAPPPRPSMAPSAAPSISMGAPGPSPPTGMVSHAPMATPSVSKPAPPSTTPAATPKVASAAPAPKSKGSGIGGAKKWFTKIKLFGDSSSSHDEIAISQPREFRHESHIGWDPSNGFEIRNIPPQWRKLFQAAGIKKSELRDAETAKFIMDTVAEATMGANPVAGPPSNAPPPPSNAPPPPSNAPPPPAGGPPPPAGGPEAGGPPPPVTPRGAPPPPASGGGMLAGLQSVKLKSAEDRVPNLGEIPEDKQANLADTLAKAMESRRDALQEDSDDAASDDEWSD